MGTVIHDAARRRSARSSKARGFRQFLLRGVEKVAAESGFVCIVHYILKLAQGWTLPEARLATG